MNARERFHRAANEAIGYLALARLHETGPDRDVMAQKAVAALRAVTDDDDLIDELYDEDMREQVWLERHGFYEDSI